MKGLWATLAVFGIIVLVVVAVLSINSWGQTVYQSGYNKGNADGKVTGYNDGYNKGNADGKVTGYNNGYSQGKSDGQTIGYNNGYSQGKSDGQTIGYNNGYSQGKSDGYGDGYQVGLNWGLANCNCECRNQPCDCQSCPRGDQHDGGHDGDHGNRQ